MKENTYFLKWNNTKDFKTFITPQNYQNRERQQKRDRCQTKGKLKENILKAKCQHNCKLE